jgi:hypothetical protein
MARLNPKSIPMQGGSRGIPDITPEDVAGAIGMACAQGPGPSLAVLVVALRWWPGLIEGTVMTVGHRTIVHDVRVKDRRGKTIRRTITEKIPIEAPAESPSFQLVANIVAKKLHGRFAKHFRPESTPRERGDIKPRLPDRLYAKLTDPATAAAWARVVIAEFRHPRHCTTCTPWGRAGQIPVPVEEHGKVIDVRWGTCPDCAGAGAMSWGSARRAKSLGIRRQDFSDYMADTHEVALALLRELEWRGIRFIKQRLFGK